MTMLISRSTAATLRMFTGALIWAAHFATIYAVHAVACARGFAGLQWLGIGVVGWVIGIATATALAAEIAIVAMAARRALAGAFAGWMTASVAALCAFAIALQALPVLIVPACK